MLLLFCLVTNQTQKAFQLPLSMWPVCLCYITLHYVTLRYITLPHSEQCVASQKERAPIAVNQLGCTTYELQ